MRMLFGTQITTKPFFKEHLQSTVQKGLQCIILSEHHLFFKNTLTLENLTFLGTLEQFKNTKFKDHSLKKEPIVIPNTSSFYRLINQLQPAYFILDHFHSLDPLFLSTLEESEHSILLLSPYHREFLQYKYPHYYKNYTIDHLNPIKLFKELHKLNNLESALSFILNESLKEKQHHPYHLIGITAFDPSYFKKIYALFKSFNVEIIPTPVLTEEEQHYCYFLYHIFYNANSYSIKNSSNIYNDSAFFYLNSFINYYAIPIPFLSFIIYSGLYEYSLEDYPRALMAFNNQRLIYIYKENNIYYLHHPLNGLQIITSFPMHEEKEFLYLDFLNDDDDIILKYNHKIHINSKNSSLKEVRLNFYKLCNLFQYIPQKDQTIIEQASYFFKQKFISYIELKEFYAKNSLKIKIIQELIFEISKSSYLDWDKVDFIFTNFFYIKKPNFNTIKEFFNTTKGTIFTKLETILGIQNINNTYIFQALMPNNKTYKDTLYIVLEASLFQEKEPLLEELFNCSFMQIVLYKNL